MERERSSEYAYKIIELARDELACSYPFLTPAIFALEARESRESDMKYGLGRGAEVFFYEPEVLVRDFVAGKDIGDVLLHSILHCLFLHPFFAPSHGNRKLWDLSCDICIRDIETCLGREGAASEDGMKVAVLIGRLKKHLPVLNAQWLYSVLDKEDIKEELFCRDDHRLWYAPEYIPGGPEPVEGRRKWENIAAEVELSIKKLRRNASARGDFAGYFAEALEGIERRHTDYSLFLKSFGAYEEIPKVDPDSFDIALYTYGLDLYGDMPVIEPLEYSEQNTVREFAVGIDTSLSCTMEVIREFLEKTYDVLYASMNCGERKRLVIFQCDSKIQSEAVISDREELRDYMTKVKVQGRGGTDFRPVFRRIEELSRDKFFTNLRGLLYFTDGDGIYPETPPKYKTAFVIPHYDCCAIVPPWAMKVRT